MSKKIISFFLVLSVLFAVCSTAVYAEDVIVDTVGAWGNCGDDLIWTLDNKGLLTISGTGEMHEYYFDAPWLDYEVKNLVVEEGVTNISAYALADCSLLESVTMAKSVVRIDDYAFVNCIALESITFSTVLESIGEYAFENCNAIKAMVIPNTVSSLGEGAFSNCSGLKNITLGSFVMFIGYRTFYDCDSLTNVVIPDATTFIGEEAFANCDSIANVTIPGTLETIDDTAFNGCGANLTIVSTKGSAAEAYAKQKGIAFVEKADSGNIIEFGNCGDGLEWTLDSDGTVTITGSGDMYDYNASPWNGFEVTKVIIEDGASSIGEMAFAGCTGLESVTIPATVKKIGVSAFESCSALKEAAIPAAVTEIGDSAFYGCSSFGELVIPDSVLKIGGMAFYGCTSATSLKLSAKVESIGEYAFGNCPSVTAVTIPETATYIGYCAFGFYYDGGEKKVANFTITGVEGSEAEVYANDNGFTFVAMEPVAPIVKPDQSSDYYMNDEAMTMPNVVAKTNVSTLVSALAEYGITVTVTDNAGKALEDTAKVGTGCKVTDANGNTYTVIVVGDTDGSGVVDATDYLRIKSMFLGSLTLENEYLTAADADGSGKIDSTDYLRIKSYFLGTLDLYA